MSEFTSYTYCPNCTTTRTTAYFGTFCRSCGYQQAWFPTFIAKPIWGGFFSTKLRGYQLRDGIQVEHGREAIEYEQDALLCKECGAHLDICEGVHAP